MTFSGTTADIALARIGLARIGLAIALVAVGGCQKSQPTIVQTNASTDAQLNDISAHTNQTDGMDQGNAALLATPTTGQQMDAKEQPPKH